MVLLTYPNDNNINILYIDTELDSIKYKQEIPLKTIEMNIPINTYSVK